MRALVAVMWICLLGGCVDDELVLVVDLRTDLVPGVEFQRVRTIVETGDDSGTFVDVAAMTGAAFITGQRIAELTELASGPVRIRVEAQTEAGTVVAARPVSITLTESLGVTVVLSRACQGLTCPIPDGDPLATACIGAVCGDAACTVENPGACGSPECSVDTDCATGAPCAAPVCTGGVCLLRPDDATCAAEEYCDPDVGCRLMGAFPPEVYLRMVEEMLVTGVTRRAADGTLVGDMLLSEVGPNTYDFVVRGARLEGGVPSTQPSVVTGTATIEGDGRWLMDPDDPAEVPVVAMVTIDGRRWTFDNDLTDPRSDPAFGEYVIADVAEAPVRDQVGAWDLVSLVSGGMTRPAGTCEPVSGGTWTITTQTLDVDENNASISRERDRDFSDPGCMAMTASDSRDLVGFAIQEGGDTAAAYLWDTTADSGVLYRYTYSFDGDGNMSFAPFTCLPAGCGAFAEVLTFAPR